MPNKKSAMKHLRQTLKHTERNALVKRNIKEIIKQGKKAIADGTVDKKAGELVHSLQKAIDKAVKSGALKANTGNRQKTRFADMLKKAGAKIEASGSKTDKKEQTKK